MEFEIRSDCPYCRAENNRVSPATTQEHPKDEDCSICWACGKLAVFKIDGDVIKTVKKEDVDFDEEALAELHESEVTAQTVRKYTNDPLQASSVMMKMMNVEEAECIALLRDADGDMVHASVLPQVDAVPDQLLVVHNADIPDDASIPSVVITQRSAWEAAKEKGYPMDHLASYPFDLTERPLEKLCVYDEVVQHD